jgi:hypothetical protein
MVYDAVGLRLGIITARILEVKGVQESFVFFSQKNASQGKNKRFSRNDFHDGGAPARKLWHA